MCILSPRDIMVVQEVFMTYLFIEKIYIQSRFSGHAISISDIVQTTILGLVLYQTLFSMTPPPMSLGDKSAVCRTLPVQLKMKQLVFAGLLSKQLSSSENLIKKSLDGRLLGIYNAGSTCFRNNFHPEFLKFIKTLPIYILTKKIQS